MNICMYDVGDGLNMFIDHDMMVDFGGEKEKLKYRYHHRCCHYCFPFHHIKTFVLSHFHEDHYNGLFLEDEFPHYYFHDLEYVYYQGIPIIVDEHGKNIHTQFLSYLMAMNHYMLSDQSGVASADLISRLQQLSRKTFKFSPLFKGDTFTHNTRKYEVLWPPRIIKENETVAKIEKAIEDFENAKKDDDKLSALAERYQEIAEKYARNGENTEERKYEYPNDNMRQEEFKSEIATEHNQNIKIEKANKKDLPDSVQEANKSLRDAANDLSLAFKTESNLLFFGDLETNQINTLCDELNGQNFNVFVTPHHGTHFGSKMKQINSKIALSSVGKLYDGYLKNKYLKAVSNHLYSTKKDGCLCAYAHSTSVEIEMCKHYFEKLEWR